MSITPVQMDTYSKLLQSLSNEDVSRLMLLKKDTEMVCIKNLYDERMSFDSFEEYYSYYTGNRFRFNVGDRVKIDTFYSLNMILLRPIQNMSRSSSSYFRIFNEIEDVEAMKHFYLFEYFMFASEWDSLNREEQISTVLD
jgi:hypothetical protein